MDEFYGIDLGTTNSCIATIDEDDLVVVVTNKEGLLTTPSVVAYNEKGIPYVGTAAKANLGNDPERTVAFIKREMSNNNYSRRIGNIQVDPVEISSLILKKLVDDANQKRKDEEGKDPIYRVVITVPAYFGNAERERTAEAGRRASAVFLPAVQKHGLREAGKKREEEPLCLYRRGGCAGSGAGSWNLAFSGSVCKRQAF